MIKTENNKVRGVRGSTCYRQSCEYGPAMWYNFSTKHWYCRSCASTINVMNQADAQRLYGHDLCLYDPDTTEVI